MVLIPPDYAECAHPSRRGGARTYILTDACSEIETQKPTTEEGLLKITHHATERLNDLQHEFWDNETEIETGAREAIGAEFEFIARNYGFEGVDIEDVIAPRDW